MFLNIVYLNNYRTNKKFFNRNHYRYNFSQFSTITNTKPVESVQFNWHTFFNVLARSLFLSFFNSTLWKCLKLTFKPYPSQRHRHRKKKKKFETRRRIRRRRKQINHAYTKINKETKANRGTCIGWISRRRKNKDNFAFSLLLYKTPGSHAKIESNTGTERYVREEAAKKEKEWRRESNPPLTAIVALFWGRGRQKWRRPPVRPLFFVRASALRLDPTRSWIQIPQTVEIGGESMEESRWNTLLSVSNDCNPTPARLIRARASGMIRSRPRTLGTANQVRR